MIKNVKIQFQKLFIMTPLKIVNVHGMNLLEHIYAHIVWTKRLKGH